MAIGSIAATVNRQVMGLALAQAREDCASDRSWLNAVNRAALNLEACQWQFDGVTLVVKSATDNLHYSVNADGCECKAFQAGRPCWHRAARRLLLKAAELAPVPAPRDVCPMCGALVEATAYTINNRRYAYFEVCEGDGRHRNTIMPGVRP